MCRLQCLPISTNFAVHKVTDVTDLPAQYRPILAIFSTKIEIDRIIQALQRLLFFDSGKPKYSIENRPVRTGDISSEHRETV